MERGYSKHWYAKNLDFGLLYLGVPTVKNPLDLWMYQEVLFETRPDLVIETGTAWGGSALYLAHLMDQIGHGRVISIDLAPQTPLPDHPRVDYWTGKSSVDADLLDMLNVETHGERCMVILDSDHTSAHVLAELDRYHRFVACGCYLIVEDTNPDGYRMFLERGNGPAEAVRAWQPANKGFQVDRSRERLGFTQNPGAYLKRVR